MKMFQKMAKLLFLIAAVTVFFVSNSTVGNAEEATEPSNGLPEFANEVVHPNFSSGGADHTHQYIVAQAIAILNHDLGPTVISTYRSTLLYYTDWPDKYENDLGTFARHFYDPDTGKNWLGQTSPTAKTRAEQYYQNALEAYRMGDVEEAFIHLGKGTHYVSDINVPHHAANLTALNSNHTQFEKYIDKSRLNYTIPGNTLPEAVYKEALNTSVSDSFQDTAVYSKSLAKLAQQSEHYDEIGQKVVPHAIVDNVQYIYKFCKEVGILK
ncbi:MAG: zinc dependent phospholipase C family protein [Paenibacillus macerans]|uniref:Phospholipase C n=1 Tax=Paenibacillus macerans TaxID=44252 RepID=A0A090ZIC6_PAEMA|nr:zinc dependent phospholipase C family protein [Paenibacillus macerans]KFN10143.1 zinc dependent phospholipase C family protein [Paenibacillus macerans]MCY7560971.1 zinc dependent phospholipase C family protein [Paenibacillus macerans]MDU7473369.1 zinc dependent phospholipase C family protein [Paenibacillus macerans]MEC0153610.1 zinc dependent phospholipase C family protein [Paenibacillus macerans]SUD26988.1 Phospholipase C precursor [Paenibacillus macerans]